VKLPVRNRSELDSVGCSGLAGGGFAKFMNYTPTGSVLQMAEIGIGSVLKKKRQNGKKKALLRQQMVEDRMVGSISKDKQGTTTEAVK
jgi:hypothetical protein